MNLNPFSEKSLNTLDHNKSRRHSSKPSMDSMYVTAAGFGKQTKPANTFVPKQEAVGKKTDKENTTKSTFAAEDVDMKNADTQPVMSGFVTSRDAVSSEINAKDREPIGPQKNKDNNQQAKKSVAEDVEMNELDGDCDNTMNKSLNLGNDSSDADDHLDSSDPQFHAKQIHKKFKLRLKEYKKKQLPTLVKPDQQAWKDP